jgi:hypothetical protein
MRPLFAHFAAGAALGVVMAVVGVYFGFISAIATVALVVIVGLIAPHFAFLSGGLTAIGLTWLALVANSAIACARTENFCGNANIVPMLAISVAIAIVGASLGLWTLMVSHRSQTP